MRYFELYPNPLVSIVVITYNSAKSILETLESVKRQTYQNIELVISDDGSTDKTVEICNSWLIKNKDRFIYTKLITIEINTGISPNCNRGVNASTGEWIKLIAGDDELLPDCITFNIETCTSRQIDVLQTNLNYYDCTFDPDNYIGTTSHQNSEFFKQKAHNLQYEMLLYSNFISAPSIFLSKHVIQKVDGFDESIPLIEDYPLWLMITSKGYIIEVNDKVTVNYRISENSVIKRGNKVLMNDVFAKNLLLIAKKYKRNKVNSSHYFFFTLSLRLILALSSLKLLNKFILIDKIVAVFTRNMMELGNPFNRVN